MVFDGLVPSRLRGELTKSTNGCKTSGIRVIHQVVRRLRRALLRASAPQPESSFGTALAGLPTDLDLPHAADFRVVVEGRPRELRPRVQAEVYRIVREAVVNAHRHSGARNIEALIAYRPGQLRVSVRDNGCGIDPEGVHGLRRMGCGLQVMRGRADGLGARLRVRSRRAYGTEVELSVAARIAFEPDGRHGWTGGGLTGDTSNELLANSVFG